MIAVLLVVIGPVVSHNRPAECTNTVSCIWPDDGSIEPKHVAEFLILITNIYCGGHAVAQLVDALCYKPEGRGFDSRWCHWNFSLT